MRALVHTIPRPHSHNVHALVHAMPLPSRSHQTVPLVHTIPRARRYEGTEGDNFSATERQQRLAARLQKKEQRLEELLEKQWEAAHPSGLVDEDHPTDYKVHTGHQIATDGR